MPDLRRELRNRSYLFALLLAAVLLIVNVVLVPGFASPGAWAADLKVFAPLALLAMASTPAVLSGGGGLDLSVGPLADVISIVLIVVLLPTQLGAPALAIPILLLLGAGVGVVNGLVVARLRYPPFVSTLCAFLVLYGVGLKLAPKTVNAPEGWTHQLGASIGPVPGPLLLLLVPPLVWLVLGRTRYLRTLLAVGASDRAAFSAGVKVAAVRVVAYGLGGLFAAVAGIAVAALAQSADPNLGLPFALVALAAVVLGGTPIGGGRGGLVGSVIGAAIIYLVQNLLSALHVSAVWLPAAYGLLLLVGVVLAALFTAAPRAPRAVQAR
ncbi:MAG: ABC transporter permease [Candidatus Dormibacteraeota bacterium]|nr:ABC transporter permease [Candidatus Dormibacteraeota bacterium]